MDAAGDGDEAKLHTQGGPRRRPALARARQGRRISALHICQKMRLHGYSDDRVSQSCPDSISVRTVVVALLEATSRMWET